MFVLNINILIYLYVIQVGDLIAKVNGIDMIGKTLKDVYELLVKHRGLTFEFDVYRENKIIHIL